MRRARRRMAAWALVVALLLALAACGIPSESEANRIAPDDVPFGLLDEGTTTTAVTEGRSADIYLLARDKLIAVERSVPEDGGLRALLQRVVEGPTKEERTLGITSAVPVGTVASVGSSRGVATVDLNAAFGDIRASEQLLALAQIVYTLTAQPGIGGVSFTLEGDPVKVPLAGGQLREGPLSRDDFSALAPG